MLKRLWIVVFIFGFVTLFLVQSATASDPEWREKQHASFEQIGLKPGDIIDKESPQKVEGLLPVSIVEWLKKGYLIDMKIGEFKYDVSSDDDWENSGKENAGRFKLDETKNLISTENGEPPLWIYGVPFPDLDMKNDPDGAVKYMYNRMLSTFRGNLMAPFTIEWIGKRGFERIVDCFWLHYLFWARSDGEQPNPNKFRFMHLIGVTKPFDIAGLNQLTYRKLDGSADEFYVYIPAIRRVKKMSGSNRSDPYVGSDITMDDGGGFAGQTNSMTWRLIDERVGLICVTELDTEATLKLKELPDGGWNAIPDPKAMKLGWETKGWKGAKWAPTNAVWAPRTFTIIEGIPNDPYYNSGKTIYWIDKMTYHTAYKIIFDKAGEYWKTLIFMPRCIEWAGMKGYNGGGTAGYMVVDDRTHHASGVRVVEVNLDSPRVIPSLFTVERLRTVSK